MDTEHVQGRDGRASISLDLAKKTASKLPANHPFRIAIQAEDDFLTAEEYMAKLKGWLELLH